MRKRTVVFSFAALAFAIVTGCAQTGSFAKGGSFIQCKDTKLGFAAGCKEFKTVAEAKRRCRIVGGPGGS